MKSKQLQASGPQTFVLVFDKDEEFMAGLQDFADEQKLDGSRFSAIGAFSRVTLQFFDRDTMQYLDIPVEQQVEVLALSGNIALAGDERKLHAHAVVGLRDGSPRGGHVKEGYVWPTLEVVIEEAPSHLRRVPDKETGLPLLDPE